MNSFYHVMQCNFYQLLTLNCLVFGGINFYSKVSTPWRSLFWLIIEQSQSLVYKYLLANIDGMLKRNKLRVFFFNTLCLRKITKNK